MLPWDSLAAVERDVVDCRACPRLVEWRERVGREKRAAYADWDYWARPVPGFGDPRARVMIVGLAPAAHGANRTGRLFTGDQSGDFLFGALYRTGFANQPESRHVGDGLRLTGCWVSAPVKCPPPANRPTAAERDRCVPYLAAELALLPVEVVVALGGYAWDVAVRLLGPVRPKPRFGHGAQQTLGAVTLLGSYHVSQQNTFTKRLTPAMLDEVLARARRLSRA